MVGNHHHGLARRTVADGDDVPPTTGDALAADSPAGRAPRVRQQRVGRLHGHARVHPIPGSREGRNH